MIRQEKKSSAWGISRWDVAVAGSFLMLLVALGCGNEEKKISATNSDAQGKATVALSAATTAGGTGSTPSTITSGVMESDGGAAQLEATGQATASEQDIALPPEVVVSAPDSLVVPGSIVQVTAEGSSDVTEVMLSDGRGQSRPFVFDATANVWRASYRVPLRSTTERLGLSVTATNGGSRWKRVWIFLQVLPKQTTAITEKGEGC